MVDAHIVARGEDTLIVNAFHTDERGEPVKRLLDDSLAQQLDI